MDEKNALSVAMWIPPPVGYRHRTFWFEVRSPNQDASVISFVMLNKIRCHAHFYFSANQITWSTLLIQIPIFNDSVDPDQLASSEANWSWSTLFAKAGHICLCWGFMAQSTQWSHVERGQFNKPHILSPETDNCPKWTILYRYSSHRIFMIPHNLHMCLHEEVTKKKKQKKKKKKNRFSELKSLVKSQLSCHFKFLSSR